MSKKLLKSMKKLKIMILYLPTPSNISIMWNMGSILGLCLMIQIMTGFFLSMHYCPNTEIAFNSIIHIIQDIKYGWLMRNIHMNGASMYFIFMYLHMFRGMYYHSYKFTNTWNIGILIMLLSMSTAFLGYVLPWGQMSLWGATVITNLMSAIPYMGLTIVEWLWGGFTVNNATLNRFYSAHFILPFIILFMVILHLMFLHNTGSSNPTGCSSNLNKIPFHPYFTIKDFVGFFIMFMILMMICSIKPYTLSDPDNFIPANYMVTPAHIQPEWYFLFAYAILRSIPNKLGGVLALLMSILILYTLPLSTKYKMKSSTYYFPNQIMFYMFISSFTLLTWAGSKPIEYPFMEISQILSIFYFSYFILMPMMNNMWDNFLKI